MYTCNIYSINEVIPLAGGAQPRAMTGSFIAARGALSQCVDDETLAIGWGELASNE